jgi:hypothetical protein
MDVRKLWIFMSARLSLGVTARESPTYVVQNTFGPFMRHDPPHQRERKMVVEVFDAEYYGHLEI